MLSVNLGSKKPVKAGFNLNICFKQYKTLRLYNSSMFWGVLQILGDVCVYLRGDSFSQWIGKIKRIRNVVL